MGGRAAIVALVVGLLVAEEEGVVARAIGGGDKDCSTISWEEETHNTLYNFYNFVKTPSPSSLGSTNLSVETNSLRPELKQFLVNISSLLRKGGVERDRDQLEVGGRLLTSIIEP